MRERLAQDDGSGEEHLATVRLDQPGGLGEWLLPTNINRQLEGAVGNANLTLANANTNLTALFENLGRSLDNLRPLRLGVSHEGEEAV